MTSEFKESLLKQPNDGNMAMLIRLMDDGKFFLRVTPGTRIVYVTGVLAWCDMKADQKNCIREFLLERHIRLLHDML